MHHIFELQQKNGMIMGKMLFYHQSCSNIVCFIAREMWQHLVSFILNYDAPQ